MNFKQGLIFGSELGLRKLIGNQLSLRSDRKNDLSVEENKSFVEQGHTQHQRAFIFPFKRSPATIASEICLLISLFLRSYAEMDGTRSPYRVSKLKI